MESKNCKLFVFDGFADWEPALAIAGLRQYGDFSVALFSTDGQPVTSMGGMRVQPQTSLDKINPDQLDLLILPGGESWEQNGNQEVLPLVKAVIEKRKTLAAICGATLLLGKAGMLDTIPHTSNGLVYLRQFCPDYKGESFYQQEPCVSTGNIITANGAGMIEFAHEIYKAFEIFDEDTLMAVKDLYKTGGMDTKLYEQQQN